MTSHNYLINIHKISEINLSGWNITGEQIIYIPSDMKHDKITDCFYLTSTCQMREFISVRFFIMHIRYFARQTLQLHIPGDGKYEHRNNIKVKGRRLVFINVEYYVHQIRCGVYLVR